MQGLQRGRDHRRRGEYLSRRPRGMGTKTAIEEWQRGVVAIGACDPNLPDSELHGSGFIVDLQAGLIIACAHVVLGIYKQHLKPTATALDPGGAAPNAPCIAAGPTTSAHWSVSSDGRRSLSRRRLQSTLAGCTSTSTSKSEPRSEV